MRKLGRACIALALTGAAHAAVAQAPSRGELLFDLAGCANCHTDVKNKGPLLAGGRALKTPFGTFRAPNITPDREHGIGAWSDADFIRALREGKAPDGSDYYPAFPYTSYTRMTDADMLAIKQHIFTLPAVAQPDQPHELSFPFDQRWGMALWKLLYFRPGAFQPDPGRPEALNRGAYLVEAVGHCGECHTPRDFTGAINPSRWLAGSSDGAEGEKVPNITPDPDTGLGKWSEGDVLTLLDSGMLPDGDIVGGSMWEVVERGTDRITQDDRKAIAAYLRAVPPIRNDEAKATQP